MLVVFAVIVVVFAVVVITAVIVIFAVVVLFTVVVIFAICSCCCSYFGDCCVEDEYSFGWNVGGDVDVWSNRSKRPPYCAKLRRRAQIHHILRKPISSARSSDCVIVSLTLAGGAHLSFAIG